MRGDTIRFTGRFLVLFAVVALCGCSGGGSKKKGEGWHEKKEEKKDDREGRRRDRLSADWDGDAVKSLPRMETKKFDEKKADDKKGESKKEEKKDDRSERPLRDPKVEGAHVGGVSSTSGKKGPPAGILTAGSFDDNRDLAAYRSFFRNIGQDGGLRDLPGRFLGHRLILTVKDDAGNPVGNARVSIAGEGGPAVELVSRTDGRVIFIPAWDNIPADADFQVTVRPPGGAAPVRQTVARTAVEHTITLPSFRASAPMELDLTLVIDTTGSMGDELEYIKAEMRSIARTVNERFPNVSQRYALVFYRDEGDEYVTRRFDFTSSIDDVRKNLHAQSARGGGDPPEAMHRGLEEAVGLDWRKGNTARVLFLIADAPPHAEHMTRTANAVDVLRKKGVAIYPVACSGYDVATEFVMRTSAMLTGGQFLFLTDDSGVGNAHAEPHLTNYHVERLNQLMIRMIAGELAGKRLAPEPGDILRTVGRPQ